jgi:hypothetical protein
MQPPSRNADLVIVDGKARGESQHAATGEIERRSCHAVLLPGGYGKRFSCHNAMGSNAIKWENGHKKGAFLLQNPLHTNSIQHVFPVLCEHHQPNFNFDVRSHCVMTIPSANQEEVQYIRDGKENQQNYLKKRRLLLERR